MAEEKRQTGLTESQVLISRKKYGENVLTQKKRRGFMAQYLSSFSDPIIRILLCVLAVNFLFLFRGSASVAETIGVAVAVLLSTLVSTISSYSSENAFEELQKQAAEETAKVRRAKGVKRISATELVVGDIVYLEAGERIPADGRLISGALKIDQSALNGESAETEKLPLSFFKSHEENKASNNSQLNKKDALFKGCIVSAGEGVMIVERVGDYTFYGRLARDVQEEPPASPLKLKLSHLAKILSRLGYIAAVLVAFADLFNSFFIDNSFNKALILKDFSSFSIVLPRLIHALELAIAVIVVAVPEGLPMMIAVVLSANTLKMKKDNVLVKKSTGIESAGGMNILFTDKTGTLTKGELAVEKIALGEGKVFNDVRKCPRKIREILAFSASFNSASTLDEHGFPIGGNSTDRALLKDGIRIFREEDELHQAQKNYQIVKRIPFSSENKLSAVYINDKSGGGFTLLKGAPEKIFDACSYTFGENGEKLPFHKEKVEYLRKKFSCDALRVIGVAVADGNKTDNFSLFTFVAIIGISDEVRPEVPAAIKEVGIAGIQVSLITGDHPDTAVAVAKKVGILTGARGELIYTGEELAALSDRELKEKLPRLKVVARALPQDKSRLVRLAQEKGLVVGMTGDGINDAPALKKADVGFALGSGTEIAKEAGDIVITDDNFLSIVKAVRYGRTIFKSIRKFVVFQLTMNFCAVGVSLIAPFIGVDNPVTVIQMLWINIIMDTLAGLAFAGEAPLPEYMTEPPKKRIEPVLNYSAIRQILLTGTYTVGLCLAFLKFPFFKKFFRYYENPIYHQTAFFALFVFSGLVGAFTARTERLNLLSRLKDNKFFAAFILLVAAVQLLIVYFGGNVFRTGGMTIKELGSVILLALTVAPVDFIGKISRKVYKTAKKRKRIKLTFSANNSKIKV